MTGSRILVLTLLALFGSGPVPPLHGQEGPFALQLRSGVAVPLGSFRREETGWEGRAGQGISFGMGFTFPLYGPLGGSLGFSQHRFHCDETVCPDGKDWASTGFDIALRMVLGQRAIRPWLLASLHTPRFEGRVFGESGRAARLTSEGGSGIELGGGLLIQIAERMSLSPGVRYGTGDVPFTGRPSIPLQYLLVDLGLVLGF